MRLFLALLLITASPLVMSDGPKVHVFGKEISLPKECVVYAQPSVLDSYIKYVCLGAESETWIFFQKHNTEEMTDMINKGNASLIKSAKNITHYRLSFTDSTDNVIGNIACNKMLCIYVPGTNEKLFKELMWQVW